MNKFADDLPHLSRLEAHVFTDHHGPEELFDQSTYS
jgi:hypothetical protein